MRGLEGVEKCKSGWVGLYGAEGGDQQGGTGGGGLSKQQSLDSRHREMVDQKYT